MKTVCVCAITLFCTLFIKVQSTNVSSCANIPFPLVEIPDCDQQPCIVRINSTLTTTLTFTTPRKLEHIAPRAVANALGLNLTYPLEQTNACEGLINIGCPLEEGQLVKYTHNLFIPPIFPAMSFQLQFSLVDLDKDQPFECFKVDLEVLN